MHDKLSYRQSLLILECPIFIFAASSRIFISFNIFCRLLMDSHMKLLLANSHAERINGVSKIKPLGGIVNW
jgi:hypothetical protein